MSTLRRCAPTRVGGLSSHVGDRTRVVGGFVERGENAKREGENKDLPCIHILAVVYSFIIRGVNRDTPRRR